MRENKFRAWDEEVKNMYYPPNEHIIMEMGGKCLNLQNGVRLVPLFWTGLHDKNWKEIWEGDILRQFKGSEYSTDFVVRWNQDRCGFWLNLSYKKEFPHLELAAYREGLEVIGNIYEHPELLAKAGDNG